MSLPSFTAAGCSAIAHDMRGKPLFMKKGLCVYHPDSRMIIADYGTSRASVIAESFNWASSTPEPNFSVNDFKSSEENRLFIDGLCTSLAGPWSFNYFHWCEELARAVNCEHIGLRPTYIVPSAADLYRESLVYFGVDIERIRPFTGMPIASAEYLVLPQVHMSNPASAPYARLLRESAKTHSKHIVHETKYDACFLLRKSGPMVYSNRNIVNEQEILELCSRNSIASIDTASYSFSQQVALFQNMKIVSGVHGAGLMNQLWMPEGGCVIDALSPKYINPVFASLANSLGHNYQMILQTYIESAGMLCDPAEVLVPSDQLQWALANAKKMLMIDT